MSIATILSKALPTPRRLLVGALISGLCLVSLPSLAAGAQPTPVVEHHTITIEGIDVFYRTAGPPGAPVILLLHGFPSSSHMFRNLIPRLADRYRVIAPDYPGFGESAQPSLEAFPYTFEAIANIIDRFTQAVGAKRYFLYMQDYGGPVGFRLALKHPERVQGLIIQNAVANAEGWDPEIVKIFLPFWQNRTAETEKPIRAFLSAETTTFQYRHGATRLNRLQPEAWVYDQAKLDRPGNADIQTKILFNYQDNLTQYPNWRDYLKGKQPAMLIAWGKNDPFFNVKAVDFYKSVVPKAEIHLFDAGHFALETHSHEISSTILNFLDRRTKAK